MNATDFSMKFNVLDFLAHMAKGSAFAITWCPSYVVSIYILSSVTIEPKLNQISLGKFNFKFQFKKKSANRKSD